MQIAVTSAVKDEAALCKPRLMMNTLWRQVEFRAPVGQRSPPSCHCHPLSYTAATVAGIRLCGPWIERGDCAAQLGTDRFCTRSTPRGWPVGISPLGLVVSLELRTTRAGSACAHSSFAGRLDWSLAKRSLRRRKLPENGDAAFRATYAELYDRYLVPLLFAPYAGYLADRVQAHKPHSVLETAAGTGILSQALVQALPAEVAITATDLNQPMIDRARAKSAGSRITWQQADAMQLPFPNESFELMVCQFGVTNRRRFGKPHVYRHLVAGTFSLCGTTGRRCLTRLWRLPPTWLPQC